MIPDRVFVLFAVLMATSIASFFFYERLVKRQHAVARDAWEADGRPPGFLWAGDGSSLMKPRARDRAMLRWLVSTPDWVKGDSQARAAHRGMRVSWLFGLGIWLWFTVTLFTGGGAG